MLGVPARQVIRGVTATVGGHTAKMYVGVQCCSRTHHMVEGVAEGVVHRNMYYQIAVAACGGVPQVLGVPARQVIRGVTATVGGHTAKMYVGVQCCSGTHHMVEGVAKGVGNGYIYRSYVAIVCVQHNLVVGSLQEISGVVVSELGAGAKCSVYRHNGSIHHFEVDNQRYPTACRRFVVSLHVLPRLRVRITVGIERKAFAHFSINGVAYGVAHSKVHHHHAVAPVYRCQPVGVPARGGMRNASHFKSASQANNGV